MVYIIVLMLTLLLAGLKELFGFDKNELKDEIAQAKKDAKELLS